jgi:hypothetical protein
MKITVNYPNRPEGADIVVSHLGVYRNGEEHTVDEDKVEQFESQGYTFPVDGVYGEPLTSSKNKTKQQGAKPEVKE